jgi:hypothetical protein
MAPPQKQISCLIFVKEEAKRFVGGLLGDIDMHRIHILVDSNGELLKEPSDKAEQNMRAICEGQELPVLSMKLHKQLLVVEVDQSMNPIHEQMSWRDIKPADKTALGWRTIFYPCLANTVQECLGFSAAAQKDSLGGQYTVASIIPLILKPPKE